MVHVKEMILIIWLDLKDMPCPRAQSCAHLFSDVKGTYSQISVYRLVALMLLDITIFSNLLARILNWHDRDNLLAEDLIKCLHFFFYLVRNKGRLPGSHSLLCFVSRWWCSSASALFLILFQCPWWGGKAHSGMQSACVTPGFPAVIHHITGAN